MFWMSFLMSSSVISSFSIWANLTFLTLSSLASCWIFSWFFMISLSNLSSWSNFSFLIRSYGLPTRVVPKRLMLNVLESIKSINKFCEFLIFFIKINMENEELRRGSLTMHPILHESCKERMLADLYLI